MAADASSGTANSAKVVELEVTDEDALDILSAMGNGLQKATLVICPPPATATAPQ